MPGFGTGAGGEDWRLLSQDEYLLPTFYFLKRLTIHITHRADFQFVPLERLQPHQGPNASANQDFITNVVLQDVGKFLGICCKNEEGGDTFKLKSSDR